MMSNKLIFDLCKNKTVLHLGALGDYKRYLKEGNLAYWDFTIISKISKRAIGIDIDKKGVALINRKGYKNVFVGDVESLRLNETFDVIYAGDLIEHLNNIGKFLENCKRHMHKDSSLIITTPNPYSINFLLRAFISDASPAIYPEHTVLLHEKTMRELVRRFGMTLEEVNYFTLVDRRNIIFKLLSYFVIGLGRIKKTFNQSYFFKIKKTK